MMPGEERTLEQRVAALEAVFTRTNKDVSDLECALELLRMLLDVDSVASGLLDAL